jgi:hypothetical protein
MVVNALFRVHRESTRISNEIAANFFVTAEQNERGKADLRGLLRGATGYHRGDLL